MKPFILLLTMLFICSCGGKKDILQFNLVSETIQLDWNRASDTSSFILLDNIMEGLTSYATAIHSQPDLIRPMPALASSWTVSNGGKKYLFYLRPGVKWSDGKALEAKQFVDSFQRVLSPDLHTNNAYHFFDITGAQEYAEGKVDGFENVGIKALGTDKLEFTLRRPVPYFLHLVASANTFPVRSDLIQKFGEKWSEPENLVVLGPYKVFERVGGDRIILEANRNYWGPEPEISKVICRQISEPITALALYENGELDILPRDLPSSYSKELQLRADYKTGPRLSVTYLGFNTRKLPFSSAENRKTFIRAMDRNLFASFFQGSQSATTTWIPPGMIGFNANTGIHSEALPGKFSSGTSLEISYSGNDTWNLVFQSVQDLLDEKLKTKSKLIRMEWKEYRELLAQVGSSKKSKFKPNLYLLGWVADYPDPHNFMGVFASNSESNYTGWSNPKYDELLARAVAVEDEQERANIYSEAQKILLEEEAVIMPLFFTSHQALIKNELQGVNLNPLDKWYFKNFSWARGGWYKKILSIFRKKLVLPTQNATVLSGVKA